MRQQCIDLCGQWEGPFELDISCPDTQACPKDEIVHAALIPSGVHVGDVVLWTRCVGIRGPDCNDSSEDPYRSHILDAQSMAKKDVHPTFDTAYPGSPEGPFCSGHAWILDQNENPKLLVVGGLRLGGTDLASSETFWFDPNSTTLVPGSTTEIQHWFDGPAALPMLEAQDGGTYYPSVLTFLDPARVPPRFRPIVIGGTQKPGGRRYSGWWTMDLPPAGSSAQPQWAPVTNPDGYKWPYYPRAMLVHNESEEGEIVTAGVDLVGTPAPPCQRILTASSPQVHEEFVQPTDVGFWHANNAALLHTLKPGWQWDTEDPLAQYQLNRFIGTMGTEDEMSMDIGTLPAPVGSEPLLPLPSSAPGRQSPASRRPMARGCSTYSKRQDFPPAQHSAGTR
jgi:hypothetical protein